MPSRLRRCCVTIVFCELAPGILLKDGTAKRAEGRKRVGGWEEGVGDVARPGGKCGGGSGIMVSWTKPLRGSVRAAEAKSS